MRPPPVGPKIFVSCLLRFPPQFDQSSQNSRQGDAYLKQDQRTISRPNMAWMCSASIGFKLRSCPHIVFLLDRMEWFFNWCPILWKVLDCRCIVHRISCTPGECVEAWHMCLVCPTGFGASFCRLFSANIQHWAFDRTSTNMCSGIKNIGLIIHSEYYMAVARLVEDMGRV